MPFRYDESHPQLLIVYTGTEHDASDYQVLSERWAARIEAGERFGVVMVNEPHTHDEDEETAQQEIEAINKVIGEFRRNWRQQSNQFTLGWANVYEPDADWLVSYLAENENGMEALQEISMSRAIYMFGTRGRMFTDVEAAKAWLLAQADLAPVVLEDAVSTTLSNTKVGLFYGSSTGTTQAVAFEIRDAWQAAGMEAIEAVNIAHLQTLQTLLDYEYLLLGLSTWNIGELQDDWDNAFPKLEDMDFSGKKIALFGVGDQIAYPDNFLDALGILGHELRERGATLYGFVSTESYDFDASAGVEGDQFMGLGIDDANQGKLSEARIQNWVEQVIHEFALAAEKV